MQTYSAVSLVILLSFVVVICSCTIVQSYDVYPVETCQQSDADVDCLTLSVILKKKDKYFTSNLTLVFHKGEHILQGEVISVFISNFTLQGYGGNGSCLSTPIITCVSSSLSFVDVSIRITSIHFNHCNIHLFHADVTLQNSRFENARAVYGGALDVRHSRVQLDGVNSFGGNIAEKYGGAIYAYQSTITFSGRSAFTANQAQYGGAVYCREKNCLSFSENSNFVKNTAELLGGAVYAWINNTLTVNGNIIFSSNTANFGGAMRAWSSNTLCFNGNSSFMHNTALVCYGGAVAAGSGNTLQFSGNSSFTYNMAEKHGGAIYVDRSAVTFSGSTAFTTNQAKIGGALYCKNSTSLSFNGNSRFSNNAAQWNGGAVYAWINNTLSYNGNTFFLSNTGYVGGAVCALANNTLGFNGNSSFMNNTAEWYGGAVYALDSNTLSFNGDSGSTNNIAKYGGAMRAVINNTVTFSGNNSFLHNHAAKFGGALNVWDNNTFCLNGNSRFISNTAEEGGAIEAESRNNLSFIGISIFTDNRAYDGGALCAMEYNTLSFSNTCSLMSNMANRGGAVYALYSNTLSFEQNSIFMNNMAFSSSGGAVFVVVNNTLSLDHHSSFLNNTAEWAGGALKSLRYNILSFNGKSSFMSNTAKRYHGGAVSADVSNSLSFHSNSSFISNTAALDGGAVYAEGYNTLNFNGNSEFMSNTADAGGAVYADSSNTLSFTGSSSFMSNTADDDGGVMHAESYNTLSFNGSTCFISNTADAGGAVYADASNTLTFIGSSTFINNTADDDGGAVYADASNNLSFNGNSSFINNTSEQKGGAVHAEDSNRLNFKDNSSFMSNTAYYGGGAVSGGESNTLSFNGNNSFMNNRAELFGGALSVWVNNTLSLDENSCISFTNNTVGAFGGAIHARSKNTLTFNADSSFMRNTAFAGGAVDALDRNTFSCKGTSGFVDNAVEWSGGSVYAWGNNTFSFSGNTVFMSNTALEDGGALSVHDSDTFIFNGTSSFMMNTADGDGGAVHAQNSSLHFYGNSTLEHNKAARGGGIAIYSNTVLHLEISGIMSLLYNNASFGGGAFVQDSSIISTGNITVTSNKALNGGGLFVQSSDITLHGAGLLSDNLVTNHEGGYGGAIFARSSMVQLQGSFDVNNNIAEFGGGLAFFGVFDGVLIIKDGTNLTFKGNLAHRHGGAIFVEDDPFTFCVFDQAMQNHVDELCFFQTREGPYNCFENFNSDNDHQAKSIILKLENNSASVSGDILYGGHLQSCVVCSAHATWGYTLGPEAFQLYAYSNIDVFSKLSSDPYKVCICEDSHPNCDQREVNHTIYPGQILVISVVAVGQMNGIVPSVIRAVSDSLIITSDFKETQPAENNKECSQLQYPLFSTVTYTNLTLYSNEPCSTSGYPLTILIEFVSCPVGFTLSEQGACICDERLQKYTQNCNIENLTISRDKGDSFWVGVEGKDKLILHPHCPFDYCTNQAAYFSLNSTDSQCAKGRSGILCGACQPGRGLALGSFRCLADCSRRFIALLIVFAFAGVALVTFLFLFRVTVAEGTLSGLIFYANVLAVNQTVFFPSSERNLLTVFIAWLNLDLGIETCFFVSLDAYYRTWIQYAFPIYIWLMVCVIIVLANRSVRFSKILQFGSTNPVTVLATLFLLSYTKLLRTIMAAFSFTILKYPDGDKKYVWLYDGNIGFLDGRHIGLFLFSLLFFLFIFIPYTLLLLCGQWIQKHLWWLSITKQLYLKFFLDAHYGPYNNRHRYWTGLLLLLRFLMLFVAAITDINNPQDPFSNLLVILVVSSSLILWGWIVGRFYKSWHHDLLEASFIFNLLVLSGGTLQVRLSGGTQDALVYTSVTIVFVTFIGIVLSAVIQRIRRKLPDHLCTTTCCRFPRNQNDKNYSASTAIPKATVTYSVVEIGHKESGKAQY